MEDFRSRVLRVVRAVPPGRVTTYGTVAAVAGSPGAARQVGAVLRGLTDADADVPWQRVINAAGGISTYKVGSGELQVALLRAEGVEVENDRVNLRRFGWSPDDEQIGFDSHAAANAAR
jgi:methylated-DNA-protein-cysteine methyltransferase related protein